MLPHGISQCTGFDNTAYNYMKKGKLNILHCVSDEKFIDNVISRFEYFKDRIENKYVIVRKRLIRAEIKLKYIKQTEYITVLYKSEFLNFLKQSNIDVVILHSLTTLSPFLICKIPSNIKVVWFAWGFDLYMPVAYRPFIKISNLYWKQTADIVKKDNSFKSFKQGLKRLILNHWIKKSISRIDYFSGVIPEEYDRMKELPFFHASKVVFSYSTMPSNSADNLNCTIAKGRNILVGNSGDMTNNHLDIFEVLKNMNLSGRKIFVPLSYSGTKQYKDLVKNKGRDYWGDDFIPLENFMQYDEYLQILNSCGIRIFGHERQQAMGNIKIAWEQGCKIFLSETSMAYRFYANLGVNFPTIQHNLTQECIDTPYTEQEALTTYEKLHKQLNPVKALEDLSILIDELAHSCKK